MPSRRVVALIVLFWLGTVAFVVQRDVWPLLVSAGPPTVEVDLSDEASQFAPIRWTVTHNGEPAGRVETRMVYHDPDDTFWVSYKYSRLKMDLRGVRLDVSDMTSAVRITRAGAMREQSFDAKLAVQYGGLTLHARVRLHGEVTDGQLAGTCDIDAPLLTWIHGTTPLGPVPVPEGQALSPLQPVNRLSRLHPRQTWRVRTVDPLSEALTAMLRSRFGGAGLVAQERPELIAAVAASPEPLTWQGHEVPCWVIEYRHEGEVRARTWVRQDDGKVLRQEAYNETDRLAIERDE